MCEQGSLQGGDSGIQPLVTLGYLSLSLSLSLFISLSLSLALSLSLSHTMRERGRVTLGYHPGARKPNRKTGSSESGPKNLNSLDFEGKVQSVPTLAQKI